MVPYYLFKFMNFKDQKWIGIRKSIGPGLIMAAAAIGVSHLVQSTRAGAEFGFALVWAVLFANLFKYPFLEFGPRYAIATGQNMVYGYAKLGRWAIWLFTLFTVGTMFAILAAVTVVTASLASQLTGISLSLPVWSAIILGISILLLIRNSYSILDGAIKFLMTILAVSTIVAVVAALFQGGHHTVAEFPTPEIWTATGIAFIIALMGWMPIPIDASVWHSMWTLERSKQTGHNPSLKESLIDFNIGYIGAALFALCFLFLGALIMYGSGESFAESGAAFSQQLIQLYTLTLGDWAYTVIIICAFTTMFSTTFTVADTYPRVCNEIIAVLKKEGGTEPRSKRYPWLLIGISLSSLLFLVLMGDQFRLMIDLATTLSFLTAPVLAFINYKLIFHTNIDVAHQPKRWLQWLAITGIVFLAGFAIFYLYWIIPI